MSEAARIYLELRRVFPRVKAVTCWRQAKVSAKYAEIFWACKVRSVFND